MDLLPSVEKHIFSLLSVCLSYKNCERSLYECFNVFQTGNESYKNASDTISIVIHNSSSPFLCSFLIVTQLTWLTLPYTCTCTCSIIVDYGICVLRTLCITCNRDCYIYSINKVSNNAATIKSFCKFIFVSLLQYTLIMIRTSFTSCLVVQTIYSS